MAPTNLRDILSFSSLAPSILTLEHRNKKNYHQLDIPFSFLESPRGIFFGEKQQKDSINANVWQFSFSLLGLYEYVMLYFSWQRSLYSTQGRRDFGFFLLCINICRITDDQAYSIVLTYFGMYVGKMIIILGRQYWISTNPNSSLSPHHIFSHQCNTYTQLACFLRWCDTRSALLILQSK